MKTIKVTKKDIEKGERRSRTSCPIALACKRMKLPDFKCVDIVLISRKNLDPIPLPAIAIQFISDFDGMGRNSVKPFSFKIKI